MHALTTSELFRATWPRHTAKEAARAANGPLGTAKAWVTARFTPSADTLLRMAAENDQLRAELVRRLGGHGYGDRVAEGGGADTTDVGGVAGEIGGLDRPAETAAATDALRLTHSGGRR